MAMHPLDWQTFFYMDDIPSNVQIGEYLFHWSGWIYTHGLGATTFPGFDFPEADLIEEALLAEGFYEPIPF